jgi:hypothetical protein
VIARAVPAKHTSPSAPSVSPAARAVPVESAGDGELPVWSHPIRVFLTTDGWIADLMGGGLAPLGGTGESSNLVVRRGVLPTDGPERRIGGRRRPPTE